MKQKEKYTLEELYDNLEITLTELSKRSDMSHGTLTRIRDRVPARRSTVNKLLRVFSEIYGIELSVENVTGIALEERGRHEKGKKPPVEVKPIEITTSTTQGSFLPFSDAKKDTQHKRAYAPRKTDLLEGCILATEFASNHRIPRETFRDHMNTGLGKGLIHGPDVPEDGTVLVRDYVRYEERNKRVRKDGTVEMERFLTPDQQTAALQFWKRHDVSYSQCECENCPCH